LVKYAIVFDNCIFVYILKEAEIKIMAKRGQEQAAKTLAKQLISTRQQKQKLMTMKAQLGSTSTQVKVCMLGF
jgi:hypothetical protein